MRNLTLGILIILGGFVAALPFRRSVPSPSTDAIDSHRATGPSSDLAMTDDAVPFDPLFETPGAIRMPQPTHSLPGSPASLASAMRSPEAPQGIPSDAVARPRRDLRLPLTYDDLAVPLATPHYTDGRFDALTGQQAHDRGTPAVPVADRPGPAMPGPAMPRPRAFEPMRFTSGESRATERAPAPWEMPGNLPESILDDSSEAQGDAAPRTAARSVSTRTVDDPPPSVPSRERHWIRQPN